MPYDAFSMYCTDSAALDAVIPKAASIVSALESLTLQAAATAPNRPAVSAWHELWSRIFEPGALRRRDMTECPAAIAVKSALPSTPELSACVRAAEITDASEWVTF